MHPPVRRIDFIKKVHPVVTPGNHPLHIAARRRFAEIRIRRMGNANRSRPCRNAGPDRIIAAMMILASNQLPFALEKYHGLSTWMPALYRDALHSPVPPASIDAIKRRTRAGMGRCQGGFCQPRVLELMAREFGQKWTEVTLKGEGTNVLIKQNREGAKR